MDKAKVITVNNKRMKERELRLNFYKLCNYIIIIIIINNNNKNSSCTGIAAYLRTKQYLLIDLK